jgi:hypothetical protein
VIATRKQLKDWKEEWDSEPVETGTGTNSDGTTYTYTVQKVDLARLLKMPDRPKTARIDPEGEYIDLAAYPAAPYSIELERIDDADKLVRWIHHLAGKTWFDHHMMRDFIGVWAKHFRKDENWVHREL